jgi:hypothetical protein
MMNHRLAALLSILGLASTLACGSESGAPSSPDNGGNTAASSPGAATPEPGKPPGNGAASPPAKDPSAPNGGAAAVALTQSRAGTTRFVDGCLQQRTSSALLYFSDKPGVCARLANGEQARGEHALVVAFDTSKGRALTARGYTFKPAASVDDPPDSTATEAVSDGTCRLDKAAFPPLGIAVFGGDLALDSVDANGASGTLHLSNDVAGRVDGSFRVTGIVTPTAAGALTCAP